MGGKSGKFGALNRAMAELVEDFNLVGFACLAVEDKGQMAEVLRLVDKANGYCFGDRPQTVDNMTSVVATDGRPGR